jgi:hypothetical protein
MSGDSTNQELTHPPNYVSTGRFRMALPHYNSIRWPVR